MTTLKWLDVIDTRVTKAGLRKLKGIAGFEGHVVARQRGPRSARRSERHRRDPGRLILA